MKNPQNPKEEFQKRLENLKKEIQAVSNDKMITDDDRSKMMKEIQELIDNLKIKLEKK